MLFSPIRAKERNGQLGAFLQPSPDEGEPTHLPQSHPFCSCRTYHQRTLLEVIYNLIMTYWPAKCHPKVRDVGHVEPATADLSRSTQTHWEGKSYSVEQILHAHCTCMCVCEYFLFCATGDVCNLEILSQFQNPEWLCAPTEVSGLGMKLPLNCATKVHNLKGIGMGREGGGGL